MSQSTQRWRAVTPQGILAECDAPDEGHARHLLKPLLGRKSHLPAGTVVKERAPDILEIARKYVNERMSGH